jgi:hypothetical protein
LCAVVEFREMARCPAKPLPWVAEEYGHDAAAWDKAKRQARAVLYEWAAAGRFGSYSELAQRVTAIAWPEGAFTHHGRQMGYLLGQVSMEELDSQEDRPLLSALVIGHEDGMPSGGFWTLLTELGIESPQTDVERVAFWSREFKAACDYYGSRGLDQ